MKELELELMKVTDELSMVLAMSDKDVCKAYNTDSKQSIIETIQWEITNLQEEIDEAHWIEEEGEYTGLDPAFSSWEQVNRMFV